jgi:hypothetical protein
MEKREIILIVDIVTEDIINECLSEAIDEK